MNTPAAIYSALLVELASRGVYAPPAIHTTNHPFAIHTTNHPAAIHSAIAMNINEPPAATHSALLVDLATRGVYARPAVLELVAREVALYSPAL